MGTTATRTRRPRTVTIALHPALVTDSTYANDDLGLYVRACGLAQLHGTVSPGTLAMAGGVSLARATSALGHLVSIGALAADQVTGSIL